MTMDEMREEGEKNEERGDKVKKGRKGQRKYHSWVCFGLPITYLSL